MKKENWAYVNLTTGEIADQLPFLSGRKSGFTRIYGSGWMIMSQNPLQMIAKDKEITQDPTRVFMMMLSYVDFDNWVQVSQKEIAEELGMQKTHVSSAIKLLVKKEILLLGPNVGRSKTYRLNPNYGYKGNPTGKVQRRRDNGKLYLVGGRDVDEAS